MFVDKEHIGKTKRIEEVRKWLWNLRATRRAKNPHSFEHMNLGNLIKHWEGYLSIIDGSKKRTI